MKRWQGYSYATMQLFNGFPVKIVRIKSGAYLHAIRDSERLKTVHLSVLFNRERRYLFSTTGQKNLYHRHTGALITYLA